MCQSKSVNVTLSFNTDQGMYIEILQVFFYCCCPFSQIYFLSKIGFINIYFYPPSPPKDHLVAALQGGTGNETYLKQVGLTATIKLMSLSLWGSVKVDCGSHHIHITYTLQTLTLDYGRSTKYPFHIILTMITIPFWVKRVHR